MIKQWVIAAVAASGVVVLAANLRGEPLPPNSSAPSPAPEPITGEPAPSEPGGTPFPSPFDPADTGGPDQEVQYEDLPPADQAVMDHGRDVDAWVDTHAAFRAASEQRAREHAAETAARTLGIASPGSEGSP